MNITLSNGCYARHRMSSDVNAHSVYSNDFQYGVCSRETNMEHAVCVRYRNREQEANKQVNGPGKFTTWGFADQRGQEYFIALNATQCLTLYSRSAGPRA